MSIFIGSGGANGVIGDKKRQRPFVFFVFLSFIVQVPSHDTAHLMGRHHGEGRSDSYIKLFPNLAVLVTFLYVFRIT